ncbi:hypothetical protein RB2150_06873 [Rhodobacterales bacterium HTCC2150]|nr:hypothetical protein RB2150_06873 [Rhodobacterales bacterium HTCC2150] [Rhodobacteraceae bacterium HTCC2150]
MHFKSIQMAMIAILFSTISAFANVLRVQQVNDDVWAIVGPLEQRNAENMGNNATFGLVTTTEGAVLIDSGGSALGAAMIDDVVRSLTDEPVKYVINTGGQDHRWIGNSYWRKNDAIIISASDAVADQKDRSSIQLTMLSQLIGDNLTGTNPAYADITFDDAYTLKLGNKTFEIWYPFAAHTPGDSFVWIEQSDTVFSGDIVYINRLLGVMDFSNSAEWVEAFEAIAALNPKHVVPGHGPATNLGKARADTYDYLKNLRTKIGEHIDEGGDIIGSVNVDQSAFDYLDQFDALAGRNAQAVFEQMEWE